MPAIAAAAAPQPDEPNADDERMRRAVCGDTSAFGEIVQAYQHRIQAFAARMLGGDTERARDVAQETFLRLWQARTAYQPEGRFASYLLRITHRLCCDAQKGERKGRAAQEQLVVATRDLTQESPDDTFRQTALAQAVARALSLLPDEQRAVFVLSHYDGMKYREIAQTLDCPIGTVASRKNLAVLTLRRLLKDWTEE